MQLSTEFSKLQLSYSGSQKKTSKHRTREGRKARDLILQQFATLVLHPAVNYVPFNATIMANGYRADKNTK